jgi:hypothetical protein
MEYPLFTIVSHNPSIEAHIRKNRIRIDKSFNILISTSFFSCTIIIARLLSKVIYEVLIHPKLDENIDLTTNKTGLIHLRISLLFIMLFAICYLLFSLPKQNPFQLAREGGQGTSPRGSVFLIRHILIHQLITSILRRLI